MPSTLENKIIIDYDGKKVKIDIYDTSLGKRFIEALRDNLLEKRILEKNFCFLGLFCVETNNGAVWWRAFLKAASPTNIETVTKEHTSKRHFSVRNYRLGPRAS